MQIGLETRAILAGMLKDQLNKAALSRAEVPMDTTACEAMQECDRLLREQLFEFVSRHACLVKRET